MELQAQVNRAYMASYNGVLNRPGCRLILARSLLTSKKYLRGECLSTQLLSGLVRDMSALGPRRRLDCGTRECLRATLPVSCTVS